MAKAKVKPPAPESPPPPPLDLQYTKQFHKDAKRQEKRGKPMAKLHTVVETLRTRRPLETRHANHPLSGDWERAWDCHIEPDWILIYVKTDTVLRLMRTGSHSDLFQ